MVTLWSLVSSTHHWLWWAACTAWTRRWVNTDIGCHSGLEPRAKRLQFHVDSQAVELSKSMFCDGKTVVSSNIIRIFQKKMQVSTTINLSQPSSHPQFHISSQPATWRSLFLLDMPNSHIHGHRPLQDAVNIAAKVVIWRCCLVTLVHPSFQLRLKKSRMNKKYLCNFSLSQHDMLYNKTKNDEKQFYVVLDKVKKSLFKRPDDPLVHQTHKMQRPFGLLHSATQYQNIGSGKLNVCCTISCLLPKEPSDS